MLKTTNTEFSFIELCFTDQNNRPLEIEDNVKWLWSFGLGNISDVFNSTMREKKTLNDTYFYRSQETSVINTIKN